jgi:hypothetical protein
LDERVVPTVFVGIGSRLGLPVPSQAECPAFFTDDFDAAHQLGHEALGPHYRAATLMQINDISGHAAVLALFDEVIAAG